VTRVQPLLACRRPDEGLEESDVLRLDRRHHRGRTYLHAEPARRSLGLRREIGGTSGKQGVLPLEEEDPRVRGVDRAEFLLKGVPQDLGEGSRQLHPRGSRTDDHEREERRAPLRVGFALSRLKGEEDPPAHVRGVLDRLATGGEHLPPLVTEVVVTRAGGDQQRVGGDLCIAEDRAPAVRLDVNRLREKHVHVPLPCAGSSGAGMRCQRARGRRSRPGRGAAGRSDCCGGR